MPLPLTHIAIGMASKQLGFKSIFNQWWKTFVFIVALTNLPDIDFLFGFVFAGNGYAWHFRKCSKNKHLEQMEEEAKVQRKGLWQTPNPMPPWKYRAIRQKQRKSH